MKVATPTLFEVRTLKRPRIVHVLVALVVCAAGATYMLATLLGAAHAQTRATPVSPTTAAQPSSPAAPTAARFAHQLAGTANAYAEAHGDPTRLRDVDCVRASAKRYMCAYATQRPGSPQQCHIMQARWTPEEASTFTVTLAGISSRCGSLREALRSMK